MPCFNFTSAISAYSSSSTTNLPTTRVRKDAILGHQLTLNSLKKEKKKKKSIFTTYPADLKKEFSQITEVCVSVNSGLNYIEFDIKNKLAGLIDSGELQQLFFFLKFDIFFFLINFIYHSKAELILLSEKKGQQWNETLPAFKILYVN